MLHDHPAIADVAVVGVPDERWGESGVAFVVGTATEEELIGFCRERLARFKVPKAIRFVDELPRNSLGKVQKAALAQEVTA